jgi:hypothetical protein
VIAAGFDRFEGEAAVRGRVRSASEGLGLRDEESILGDDALDLGAADDDDFDVPDFLR